jgi:hypothetical protein
MSASNIELVTKIPVGAAAVSAAAISGRTRLYGIYYTCPATASFFEKLETVLRTRHLFDYYSYPCSSRTVPEIDIPDGGCSVQCRCIY